MKDDVSSLPAAPVDALDPVALETAVLDCAACGYVVLEGSGTILGANERTAALFGTEVRALVGRSVLELFPVDHRDEVIHQLAVLSAPESVVRSSSGADREPLQWGTLGLLPDGISFPLVVTADSVEREGHACLVLTFTRQVGDGCAWHEVVNASEQVRQFAYLASHDLRSPLSKIATLVRWLHEDLDHPTIGAANVETLQRLGHQVGRMETLMSGLLEYARAGGSRERAVDVDLPLLLYEVSQHANVPDGFELEWPDDLPRVRSQRTPLQHTLLNLISNALEHHDRLTGTVRVDCEIVSPGMLQFSVEDDGPGIPERQRERIFEIFYSLGESSDEKSRSGIGLAIVKRMVQRAGGSVRALPSRLGRGTRVVFTWPSFAA